MLEVVSERRVRGSTERSLRLREERASVDLDTLEHDDEAFFKVNALLLRNPSVVNMLDVCAISLPCQEAGSLPVGLMLWQGALHDDRLLHLALQVEAALSAAGRG